MILKCEAELLDEKVPADFLRSAKFVVLLLSKKTLLLLYLIDKLYC